MKKLLSIFKLDHAGIYFLFAISLIVLISVFILTYINTDDLLKTDYEVFNSSSEIQSFERLYSLILDAESGRRGYLLTGDEDHLIPYKKSLTSVDSIYRILRFKTKQNPEAQFNLDTLSMLVRERFDLFKRSTEPHGVNPYSSKYQRSILQEGSDLQNRIRLIIDRLENDERFMSQTNAKVKSSGTRFTQMITAGGTILSIAILVFTFVVLNKYSAHIFQASNSHRLKQEELESLVRERTAEISGLISKLYKEVDKLKKTEKALEQSELEYRTLFEQAHDAILIFAPEDEKVLNVNERACEVYKIPRDEFIGIFLTLLSKNIPDGKNHISQVLKDGFLYNFQSVHYKKDGTEMLMEINASVINYKGTKAILSINRDITDRILSYIPVPGS